MPICNKYLWEQEEHSLYVHELGGLLLLSIKEKNSSSEQQLEDNEVKWRELLNGKKKILQFRFSD